MAHFRSIIITICLTLLSINCINALFEDQVGKFDWKRSFIGKVKSARFDTKRIIVTTHENVVASLSLKTDHILWRHVLEDSEQQQPLYLHIDREVITVSGNKNTQYIRGWESATGSLLYEWSLVNEKGGESIWAIENESLVHVSLPQMEITAYNPKTGEVRWKTRKSSESKNCVFAKQFLVCLSDKQISWHDASVENGKSGVDSVQNLIGESKDLQLSAFESSEPAFLLVSENSAKLVQINDGFKVKPYSLSPNAICIDDTIYQLEANLNNPEKLIKVNSLDLETGNQLDSVEVDYPLGLGGPYIVSGQCRGSSCELLLQGSDNSLTLVRLPEGKVTWTREEALSNIVSVEFLELPVSELDASIEKEFDDASNDIVSLFLHRISTQSKQLYSLFLSGQLLGSSDLIRDDFGLHRVIVLATKAGKLFGIDTWTGSIVWTYRLPNVKPFKDGSMKLLVQRTARYAPLSAQCVLLAEDVTTGLTVVFKFDPISGISEKGLEKLAYKIKQAVLLPYEDSNRMKPIILVGGDNTVRVYPEDGQTAVKKHSDRTYVYVVDKSVLRGYRLRSDWSLVQAWEVNLGSAKLLKISTRPVSERVHSQGHVLPDRSVYYKYVNPNLIAVAALNDDPIHKTVLSVYLIDGVTGLVLYSTFHRRAKEPIHLVHSENWVVYTFFNERFRRNEIVAAEMYEGHIQSNSSAFSSFASSQLPRILSQAYILPGHPVSMTVTLTERGITNKFLLVGLSSGGVVQIPWMFVQPRFHDVPCSPEEGCIPYMPEIPLPTESNINYNLTLNKISNIEVAPAKLESTCHVLVHGLDLFYTRVAPSKTFDLLKEDFDHRLIVLVLTGLVVASYVTKFLAAKKTLRQAWK